MRKRSLRFWPRNLLLSWLLSYFLILCIPIVVSFAFYNNAYSIIKSEIMRANLGLLKQAQQVVDGHLLEIRQLSTQLTFHAEEQGMMYWEPPLTENQLYMLAKAQQTFRTYAVSGKFIDSFQLYLPRSRYVLTNTATYSDLKQFHDQMYGSTGLGFEAWQTLMNNRYTGQYIHMAQSESTAGRKPEKVVSFVRSLPLSNPTATLATVMVSINEAKLEDTIRAVQDVNQGKVFILDADRQLIASTRRMDESELAPFLAALASEGGNTQFDREGNVVNRIVSDATQWQYISVIPSSTFWEKAERIRSWSLAGLAICFLLGGIAAYYMARRQYHPVGEIMQLLSGKARQALEENRNEYQFIKETLRHSFDESEHLQQQLRQQSSVMRSHFLFRLLKGRLEAAYPVDEALAAYELNFRYGHFAVAIFHIEDFSELFKDNVNRMDEEKQLKFVQHIVRNIAEELANKTYAGYMTDLDDQMMVLLVNVPESDENVPVGGRILEFVAAAQTFIASRFYIDLTVSVSSVHLGIPGIHAAYTEALDTLEYKMVFGTNRVIAYEQLHTPASPVQTYYYPLEKEQHLINAIKTGSFVKARETLNELFQTNMETRVVSIDVARCFIFDLVGTIMKTLDELQFTDKQFMNSWDPVTRLLKQETFQDMRREMESLLEQACEWMEENKKSRSKGLFERVLRYIHEHYQDSNLSLAVIAEELNVSPGYLPRYFKEQHGDSLLDVLNQVRIQHAKRLLQEGRLTVAEIATTVGYYNSNAFIRVFKKYEGVTPGQFKEK